MIFAGPGKISAVVNWTEPTGSDTSGTELIVTADIPAPPGSELEQGIYKFEYTAEDPDGNVGKCIFFRFIQGII